MIPPNTNRQLLKHQVRENEQQKPRKDFVHIFQPINTQMQPRVHQTRKISLQHSFVKVDKKLVPQFSKKLVSARIPINTHQPNQKQFLDIFYHHEHVLLGAGNTPSHLD